jgi:hypothetical protein
MPTPGRFSEPLGLADRLQAVEFTLPAQTSAHCSLAPPQLERAKEVGLLESLLRRVPNLRLQDARGRDTDSIRRSWRILLLPLRLGLWRRRTPVEPQAALLRDAELQIMLCELRYPPIGIPTQSNEQPERSEEGAS